MSPLRLTVVPFLFAWLLVLTLCANGAWSFMWRGTNIQSALRSRPPRFVSARTGADPKQPCIANGMLCSGHGRCERRENAFACRCDVGWQSDQTTCGKLDVEDLVFNIACERMPSDFAILCNDTIPVTCQELSLTVENTCFETCAALRVRLHGWGLPGTFD